MGVETIPQNRPLSLAEAAIVRWMLQNASRAGDLSNLEPSVADLRVVGRCSCGCPSVDFMPGGQALGASLIAEAQGVTADGNAVGVLLFHMLTGHPPFLAETTAAKERIESDPRLTVEAKREPRYYLDQSEAMSKFLRILGLALTIIFSLGAIIGAMITMYAAVANRIVEIGTLRALGFQKGSILAAFILESLFLGLLGGIVGIFFASFMQLITISTMNWATFSELAFSFTMTGEIVGKSLIFSLIMGLVGGVLPAFRAARMNIVEALRAT